MDERERIAAFLRHPRVPLPTGGIGPGEDDAAVLPLGDDDLVVTTDLVTEGVHFFREAPPRLVGRFVVTVNLSDLAAMGADPAGFLVAYGTPPGDDFDWIDEVAAGVAEALVAHGCPLLGGDTKASACRTLTGTAIGRVPHGQAVRRSGARPGDLLVLTGAVGGPAAAMALHEAGDLDAEAAMRVVLDRTPRLTAGRLFRHTGASGLVDLSDGLARAAVLVAEASGRRLTLDAAAVPLDPLVERVVDRAGWATDPDRRRIVLGTGGEYELLAAVPPDRLDALRQALPSAVVVGTVTEGKGAVLRADGHSHPLDPLGWTHFS